jgi:hypothetical protein
MTDLHNPEPSRPTWWTVVMIVGTIGALYVLAHWPEISSSGLVHDVLVAFHLRPSF